MMSEAFLEMSQRCCCTLTDLLELIKHELGHTHGHTVVNVNEKLTKEVIKTTSRRGSQREDLGIAV